MILDVNKLKTLKDNGHISEEEYIDEKKRLADHIIRKQDPAYAKNGIIYILLCFFLGTLGIHNFYAGYWGRALIQLTLTIIAPWFLYIPLMIVGIWIIGELLLVNRGPHYIPFKGNRKTIIALRILAAIIWITIFYNSQIILEDDSFIQNQTADFDALQTFLNNQNISN